MKNWSWKDFGGYDIPVPTPIGNGNGKNTKSSISNGENLWAGHEKESDLSAPDKSIEKRDKDDRGRGNKPGY